MQQYPQGQDPYAAEQAYYQQQMMAANEAEQKRIQHKIDKLESKQAEKKKRDREKAKEHNDNTDRKLARDHEDNQSCANLLVMWAMLNAALWAVPLMGDDWYLKVMFGDGVEKLEIRTGLFNMNTQVTCRASRITSMASDSICQSIEPYAGPFAIEQMQDLMCKEVQEACYLMDRMFYVAHVPLCTLPAAAALEVLSALLLYTFWHGVASMTVKRLANNLACMTPIVGGIGFMIWIGFSPNMQVLPRMWAAAQGHQPFTDSGIFGLKDVPWTIPFGWCSCMVFFVWIASTIRAFCQFSMLGEHKAVLEEFERRIDEEARAEAKELVEKGLEKEGYGSTK